MRNLEIVLRLSENKSRQSEYFSPKRVISEWILTQAATALEDHGCALEGQYHAEDRGKLRLSRRSNRHGSRVFEN